MDIAIGECLGSEHSMVSTVPVPLQPTLSGNNKRKVVLVYAIIIASIVALASVSWFVLDRSFDRDGTYNHYYNVKVKANTTEEYVIRLPVPNDESERMPPRFMTELEIVIGNPVFALGDSIHGMAIEVRASGYLEFTWAQGWSESWNERYGNLTMTVGAEGWDNPGPCVSWIFSDCSDIRILFTYYSIHDYLAAPHWASGGGPTFAFEIYPSGTGWQEVPVDYGWMVIN